MTFSATVEGIWESLVNHVSKETAAEIIVDIKNTVLDKEIKNLDITTVAEEISKCSKCLKMDTYSRKVAVWNTVNPKLVVILERPNIGKEASKTLTSALTDAGFDYSNTSLTYLTKCYNSKYTSLHRENCFRYLEDELTALKPSIILACGKVVSDALLAFESSLSKSLGNIYMVGDYPVLVTYSPSFLASRDNNTTALTNFHTDIHTAAKICKIGLEK